MTTPIERLRHHVSGAIARGEKQPIVEEPAGHVMNPELFRAIEEVFQALLNVPQVGEVYDQQHSDSHQQAYLRLRDAMEQK
jgi:hypothetical protein